MIKFLNSWATSQTTPLASSDPLIRAEFAAFPHPPNPRRRPGPSPLMAPRRIRKRTLLRLAGDDMLCQTAYGFYVVVPTWNIDVGVGIIRDGIIEPWTNAVFLSLLRESDHVVNVGANFGYYAMLAAQAVGRTGRVYAVEANPVVYPYLLKSMYWSGYPDVIRAFHCAAVHPELHDQVLRFTFDPQFIGGGNLFSSADTPQQFEQCLWSETTVSKVLDSNRCFHPVGLLSEVTTAGKSLDSIIPAPVHAMLIDAEGSESFVIAGARRLIESSPDLSIIMEWDPHSYRVDPKRRPHIDSMWNFLLDEQGFTAARICPENYRGFGHMPHLQPLDRTALSEVPHSDLVLHRAS